MHTYNYSYIYIYIYVCVCVRVCVSTHLFAYVFQNPCICGGWSKFLHLQTAILRKNWFTFANFSRTYVFLSRGCGLSTFVLLRRAQTALKRQLCQWSGRQPNVGARPCWDNSIRKNRVSQFPGSLDDAEVPCGLWASMGTFSFPTAFTELSRTFGKKPLQIYEKIHTLNRAWGCSSTWLQNSTRVYFIPAIHYWVQKVLTSHLEKQNNTY